MRAEGRELPNNRARLLRGKTLAVRSFVAFVAGFTCKESLAEPPESPSAGRLSGQSIVRPQPSAVSMPVNLVPVPISARSLSGQFIIRDERLPVTPNTSTNQVINRGLVRIEPTFLAVSCE